jgi:tetratricopeptide (TPR) repeat protein
MQIPFDPGLKGWDALSLYRRATGRADTVSGRHYANLLRLHETVRGELWSAEAWVELGKGHLWRGELEHASRAFVQALLIGTSDPDSLYLLGCVHVERGELEQAEKALSQLAGAKPEHVPAQLLLARVLVRLGRKGEAGVPLLKAALADPSNAGAQWALGNWFRDLGDLEEAADQYERALAADPRHTASLFSLGCAWIRLGQPERVEEVRARLAPLSEHLAEMLERLQQETSGR